MNEDAHSMMRTKANAIIWNKKRAAITEKGNLVELSQKMVMSEFFKETLTNPHFRT